MSPPCWCFLSNDDLRLWLWLAPWPWAWLWSPCLYECCLLTVPLGGPRMLFCLECSGVGRRLLVSLKSSQRLEIWQKMREMRADKIWRRESAGFVKRPTQ